MEPTTRRSFLVSTAAVAAAAVLRPHPAGAVAPARAPRPEIHPRSEWADGLDAVGPLQDESPGEVRFLLVHHSETPNGYSPEKVAPRLRNIFGYHTGTKGWPDIAYNFFVDEHGQIWEGRTGSIERPVRGDATGGSQGHAMLCCFLGDHSQVPPTDAAVTAMARLTAWLAGVYQIDLLAGPTITFTSRGSNRWPEGTVVTTDPIAGHRDMSQTACPGDAAYPLVRGTILELAKGIAGIPTTTTTTTTAAVAPSSEPTTTAIISSAPSTSGPPASIEDRPASPPGDGGAGPSSPDEDDGVPPLLVAGGVIAAIGGGAVLARSRIVRSTTADADRDRAPGDHG